jgi:hypothetical protein
MKLFKQPRKTLPRSSGHHKEWLEPCNGNGTYRSNFPDFAEVRNVRAGGADPPRGRRLPVFMRMSHCPEIPVVEGMLCFGLG